MRTILPTLLIALCCTNVTAQGDCLTSFQFPAQAIVPNANGTVTNISTCNLAQEHSRITNIFAGANYQFTASAGAYITVRQGTANGPVVGQGFSPVVVQAVTNGDLFAHYTANDQCAFGVFCVVTTVQLLLNCTPPQAGYSVIEDCVAYTFTIQVSVNSLGDGAHVDIVQTVGADVTTLEELGTGPVTLGPFPLGTVVNVVVQHESDPACTLVLGNITDSGNCPTQVVCGTELSEIWCHGNNQNVIFNYAGTGPYPLAILFNSGFLETCCDWLRVYDGPDITAPLLTPPQGINGNLGGQLFISTNPQHALTLRITTDISISCATGQNPALHWTASCLDCAPPATTFQLVQDCANAQYFIEVGITDVGTANMLNVTNTAGAPTFQVTEPGTYQVGPITTGTPVQVTVAHDSNSLCNVTSPVFINPLCPVTICGAEVYEETYCYGANENKAWAYEKPGAAGTLHLKFLRGTIESSTWDRLRIFDGPSNNSPLLFQHTFSSTYNLGPPGSAINNSINAYYDVDVEATGNNLYMELTSDGSIHCTSQNNYDPFEWEVYCDGCAAPGIAYEMVPDCRDRTFVAEVIVSAPPGAAGLQIVNTITSETILASATGTYAFGPYPQNTPVEFMVAEADNLECAYYSGTLTYDSQDCVMVTCGYDNFNYCYGNNEDRWYTWQAAQSMPITIGFFQGQMTGTDRIIVYNGFNENAPVLFQGNNGGSFLGFAVNSLNPQNAITMRIQSDGAGSCQDNPALAELQWFVVCGMVGLEETTAPAFSLHPNPTEGTVFITWSGASGAASMRVLDAAGRTVLKHQLVLTAEGFHTVDLGGLANGQYVMQLITPDAVHSERVQVQR